MKSKMGVKEEKRICKRF